MVSLGIISRCPNPNEATATDSVADPGSGTFLNPGSEMGKKSRYGSGMNIPDHISESAETIFWAKILKFLDADADPGFLLTLDPRPWILDPGS
jgi:hypothetical protein